MSGRIAVLGTEGWAESVDGSEGRCAQFTFQLTRNREAGLLSEEVFLVGNGPFPRAFQVQSGHLEHLTCAFCIACRNDRSVEIMEPMLVKVLMYGNSHVVTNAENGPECVGAEAKMRVFPHVFEALSLLLHGVI